MAYVKAAVVHGPDAIEGKVVFGVSVDGILVKLSTYKSLSLDADRDSLNMEGQAYSPELYEIARKAVMDYALTAHADRVRDVFDRARSQPIRLRAAQRRSRPGTCPRCNGSIVGGRTGSVIRCQGCESSIFLL